ncbi:hypothetical protein ACFP2T_39430 [Plantactinospora solaniradicis]|uniref:Uncharacterized protein n=1 Tax=Plantactinospora solaniradicis TaxID=1723736 RepID=A0ABW1KK77_9ACTN
MAGIAIVVTANALAVRSAATARVQRNANTACEGHDAVASAEPCAASQQWPAGCGVSSIRAWR